MNRGSEKLIRVVALFPHEDVAAVIHEYRRRLFSSGLIGALSLPICVPLGAASRALKIDELKELARTIRTARADTLFEFTAPLQMCDSDSPASDLINTADSLIFVAPLLPNVEAFQNAAFKPYKNPALLLAVAERNTQQLTAESPFPLRFRAAYVANLIITPLAIGSAGRSFVWEQGRPAWLQK